MTDEPRRLVLWGVGTSRTLRAHWALHELGLDYERRPILPRTGETKTPEYTELNPRQKIPLLQDGDFTIAESPAIAAYLSNIYGTSENTLIPSDPREHAIWLEWCFYAATELDATSLYVMRRHGDLKRPFLVGGRFTTADMLLTTCLTWAVDYRVPVTAACLGYMERITSRPAYRTSVAANTPKTA